MPPTRTRNNPFLKLLRTADRPLYAVDAQGRLVYVNAACTRWLACDAGELQDQRCIYGAGDPESRPAEIAAVLAPPPQAFLGEICTATLHPPEAWPDDRQTPAVLNTGQPAKIQQEMEEDGEGDNASPGDSVGDSSGERSLEPLSPASFRFLPMASEAGQVTLVLAQWIEPSMVAELAPSPVDPLPAELHAQLQKLRRRRGRTALRNRFVGISASIRRVQDQIAMAAGCRAHVIICGPPGSGRQHVAAAIHASSPVADSPLIALACADLQSELLLELIEREFSQAATSPRTLLLNDVDQLSIECQQQLHRRLVEQGRGRRIIGTARNTLQSDGQAGSFHPELAMLLTTAVIELPPLESRLPDLPLLAQALLEEVNADSPKQIGGLGDDALRLLVTYHWPHDVDELMEAVRFAHGHCQGPLIGAADLPASIRLANDAAHHPTRPDESIDLEQLLQNIELECIQRAMRQAKNNKAQAARLLGLTRPRLYRRLQQLGLLDEDEASDLK